MPAWIAAIQSARIRPETIRVDLASSIPCWNDGIEKSAYGD
jgi:hypothetical protein